MKTKQELKDEAWEAYERARAPAREACAKANDLAWEAYEKRIKEIDEMK